MPKEIRALADRNYAVLKADPTRNSLQFKKVGALWSVEPRSKESEIETSLPRDSRLSATGWRVMTTKKSIQWLTESTGESF